MDLERDLNLSREIMLLIENNNDDRNEPDFPSEWSREVIVYHVKILEQAGYVKSKVFWADNKPIMITSSLTWEGHEFLDSIKNDNIWNKTKDGIKEKGLELGSVPLSVVKDFALMQMKSLFGVD